MKDRLLVRHSGMPQTAFFRPQSARHWCESEAYDTMTIAEIGEKRLIEELIRPLFNPLNSPEGVGDDCAFIEIDVGHVMLLSTDRVPADLVAFRSGILDFRGLGGYLARLNISDIAACGGDPIGLLLNLGLPSETNYDNFRALCEGVLEVASRYSCRVLGGDLSASAELSLSATSFGSARRSEVLSRRGSKPGDTIFVSRPIGLTPAALKYYMLPDPS